VNRDTVLATYRVVAWEIRDEGPWEGAPVYAPFFYAEYRRGRKATRTAHRGEGVLALHYDVTDADRAAFPELANVMEVHLFVDVEESLTFLALDTCIRRLGGRPPNVGEDEDEDDDDDVEGTP
jgi:hypothetical protein